MVAGDRVGLYPNPTTGVVHHTLRHVYVAVLNRPRFPILKWLSEHQRIPLCFLFFFHFLIELGRGWLLENNPLDGFRFQTMSTKQREE